MTILILILILMKVKLQDNCRRLHYITLQPSGQLVALYDTARASAGSRVPPLARAAPPLRPTRQLQSQSQAADVQGRRRQLSTRSAWTDRPPPRRCGLHATNPKFQVLSPDSLKNRSFAPLSCTFAPSAARRRLRAARLGHRRKLALSDLSSYLTPTTQWPATLSAPTS